MATGPAISRGSATGSSTCASLGVDAIWFTPWYVSPLADGGYDVADYRAIDPAFGTLEEAEALIADALALGIRTIIDIVPNHVSDRHPWFQAALRPGPAPPSATASGSARAGALAATSRRPAGGPSSRGRRGAARPIPTAVPVSGTSTCSRRNSPTSTGTTRTSGRSTRRSCASGSIAGAAGVRIDSAALLVKDDTLPEVPAEPTPGGHPTQDRDELHDIYRGWRAVADSYPGTRVLVGELWLADIDRFAKYLRPDELHTAFNFDFMARPWHAADLRESIDATLAAHAPVGAPATWVLSNHDVTRPVSRYGRADTTFAFSRKRLRRRRPISTSGRRRARAAALLLTAALPGSLYIYQGDELGLDEVEVPIAEIQDPMHDRSGGVDPGRDGCRVPLPWSGAAAPVRLQPGRIDRASRG